MLVEPAPMRGDIQQHKGKKERRVVDAISEYPDTDILLS